jgi:phospholipase C
MENTCAHSKWNYFSKLGVGLPSLRGVGIGSKIGASLLSVTLAAGPAFSQARDIDRTADHQKTETPIKHVIVIIGENRTFDHLFATYVPRSRDSVSNLLSKQIIKADGTPGKNFARAAQFEAVKPFRTKFFVSLSADEKKPYEVLPEPTLNFSPTSRFFRRGRCSVF